MTGNSHKLKKMKETNELSGGGKSTRKSYFQEATLDYLEYIVGENQWVQEILFNDSLIRV